MRQKRPKLDRNFKMQVYVPDHIVKKIDKICDVNHSYRSHFVTDAIEAALKKAKYKKILEGRKRA